MALMTVVHIKFTYLHTYLFYNQPRSNHGVGCRALPSFAAFVILTVLSFLYCDRWSLLVHFLSQSFPSTHS